MNNTETTTTVKIQNTFDFGLAINAATRMYARMHDQNVLNTLDRFFHHMIPYIDKCTLICVVRDLQPNSIDAFYPVPTEQEDQYYALLDFLMVEYLNRTIEQEPDWKRRPDYVLSLIGRDMYCVSENSTLRKVLFLSNEEFIDWAKSNIKKPIPVAANNLTAPVSITAEYLPDFNVICLLMVQYSVGRYTYMPDTAASFVKANLDLIDKQTALKILHEIIDDLDPCWSPLVHAIKTKLDI